MKAYVLKLILIAVMAFGLNVEAQLVDQVTLEQSWVTWQTFQHEVSPHGNIANNTFDPTTIVEREFDTWILENDNLRVTLLPDFGGRILSIINKMTGHEQLYQNPVGTPYLIGERIFYYDWLMIYGGIFPTFPEPEHGKTWFLPWEFEVVSETDEAITVKMSFVDDISFLGAPPQYNTGRTGLVVDFYITLSAGRAALDTRIELSNPNNRTIRYEYWTNAGFAPGSEIGNPFTNEHAEIIVPIDRITIPDFWSAIRQQENELEPDIFTFDSLRDYHNWIDMGIAYASPDAADTNFWGVINHQNEEGIFRIADNTITPGLKIWTFGYPATELESFADGNEWRRPFIEMWAGVTPEFWQQARIEPETVIVIDEIYAPTVGLNNVTHASRYLLVNAQVSDHSAQLDIQSLYPDLPMILTVFDSETIIFQESFTDNRTGTDAFVISAEEFSDLRFMVASDDNTLLEGTFE